MIREGWHKRVCIDLLVWMLAVLLCMLWRWIADKSEIKAYWVLFGVLAVAWVLVGYAMQLYRSYKETYVWQSLLSVIATDIVLIGLCWGLLRYVPYSLSPGVATSMILLVGGIEMVVVLMEHYWKYATNMDVPVMQIEKREQKEYAQSKIVDDTPLNDIRGINRHFCTVNQQLPDDGQYVCCYRPQEYMRASWTAKFIKRVLPKLLLTSRLYFDINKGRKRMLSKTEVLGRLYYCGFEVDKTETVGELEYVYTHRKSQPYPQEKMKIYGPLVKLPRVCENKEVKYFYKIRTMHPYAEYIQNYVFDARGGMDIADKSNDDWRITAWGRVLRKYWIDELPMLYNWVIGDMKLVGVRPLSQAMFDKYPKWLQDKRTRCKPGLIPPFYIDHPETFDELYANEDAYLTAYLEHPIKTDIRYFFLILRSILTRKTHSA